MVLDMVKYVNELHLLKEEGYYNIEDHSACAILHDRMERDRDFWKVQHETTHAEYRMLLDKKDKQEVLLHEILSVLVQDYMQRGKINELLTHKEADVRNRAALFYNLERSKDDK